MKVAGLIAEFNPLHKGHEYIIGKIKEDDVDLLICAMSPNFCMRGEPAIFDKFFRTECALNYGIDLVLEIPTIYTIESADIYSRAGITLLFKAGITDLYFGSEVTDINIYNKVLDIESSEQYKTKLNELLKEGLSFNQATKQAIISIDNSLKDYLNNPNFLLSKEYIKVIRELNLNINIHIIKRIDTGYYDKEKENTLIQSASTIRELIIDGNNKNYLSYGFEKDMIHVKNDYFEFIKYKINSSSPSEIKEIAGVSEGIENLIKKCAKCNSFDEIYNIMESKRNRITKINRILFNILLNIKKDEINYNFNYLRVLGLNSIGAKYLKEIKDVEIISGIKKDSPNEVKRELSFTRIYDTKKANLERMEYSVIYH